MRQEQARREGIAGGGGGSRQASINGTADDYHGDCWDGLNDKFDKLRRLQMTADTDDKCTVMTIMQGTVTMSMTGYRSSAARGG